MSLRTIVTLLVLSAAFCLLVANPRTSSAQGQASMATSSSASAASSKSDKVPVAQGTTMQRLEKLPHDKSELITRKEALPKTLRSQGSIRATIGLQAYVADIVKADAASGGNANAPECQVTCSHETGGISCPVGKACSCGCPGDYAKCECSN